jgi:hypothetical protein
MSDDLKLIILQTKLAKLAAETAEVAAAIAEHKAKSFDTHPMLHAAIAALESSTQWQWNKYGEIERYAHIACLADFEDCKDALEEYLQDSSCVYVDWENNVLTASEGDVILITNNPDDRKGHRGVWQERELIIPESKYTLDGEVNVRVRNRLIENHMTASGYFPGVFTSDYYSNVTAVDTSDHATNEEMVEWAKKKESEE